MKSYKYSKTYIPPYMSKRIKLNNIDKLKNQENYIKKNIIYIYNE